MPLVSFIFCQASRLTRGFCYNWLFFAANHSDSSEEDLSVTKKNSVMERLGLKKD